MLHFDYFLLFLQQFEDLQILAATTGKRERRRVFGREKMEIYERRVTSMKKLLAMVLALVMTLSLAVSANAFKDDKSISDDYAEAVAVLNGMGVFKGYEDGSFKPEGNITRAEVATIVYRIDTQMFFFHGFYNHSLELRRISFVWYSFWHSKTPYLLDSISYCLTNGVQFRRA